jgi:hypothetical protein
LAAKSDGLERVVVKLWRAAIFGLTCGALVSLPACRLTRRPVPHQMVKFIGSSYSPALAPPIAKSEPRGNLSISASGDAAVPTLALDPLEGRLVAIQTAKQAARRELARKIEALELRSGRTVADVLRGDPEKRRRVEDWIRSAKQKGLVKSDTGKCTVFLSLDVEPLKKILGAGEELLAPLDSVQTAAASPQEFRQYAEKEAIDNACAQALEYVKGIRVQENETVGERMSRDIKLDQTIRQKVAAGRAVSVNFRADGTCTATVELDLADVLSPLIERRWRLW